MSDFTERARGLYENLRAAVGRYFVPREGQHLPAPVRPTPALGGPAAHPSTHEAWAIAARANDERETVVWTAEIRDASAVAGPLLKLGDAEGARLAFAEVYQRLRAHDGPPAWTVSLGWDRDLREIAIGEALAQGRLSREEARRLLPEASHPERLRVGVLRERTMEPEETRRRLDDLTLMMREQDRARAAGEIEARQKSRERLQAALVKAREYGR